MTWDRTSGLSLGLTVGLHAGLLAWLAIAGLAPAPTEFPLLLEVTLAGNSAPRSSEEGLKTEGEVIAPAGSEESAEAPSPEAVKRWREQRKQQILKELSRSHADIGASVKDLRRSSQGLAAGRGAGEYGKPGSPRGSLSLTGAIAARGYREPDFSALKALITEETQLRITLIVLPGGEIKQALLFETSGYPYLDQKALELARKIVFDALPSTWKPVEQQGVLTVKLKLE